MSSPLLDTPRLEDVYSRLMLPAANALRDINYFGVNINRSQLADLHINWIPMYFDMEKQLQDLAVDAGWRSHALDGAVGSGECKSCRDDRPNFNSHPQRSHLVYDIFRMPITRFGRSTNADAMEQFIGQHEFFDRWDAWARLDKTLRSYVLPMTRHIREDGCCHPEVRLHNTVTGRLAYAEPPLHQIPKYTDAETDQFGKINIAVELRKLFQAHSLAQHDNFYNFLGASLGYPRPCREGYVLAEFDFARIELYTGALLSGDNALLTALKSGDFHGNTAKHIFGLADEWDNLPSHGMNSRDYWRRESKYVTFGILNNRQADALAKNELKTLTGGDPRKAQVFLDEWHRMYADYAAYKERMKDLAIENAELVSWTGRRRRFRLVLDYHALNQAINFPVQSLASDVCLSALIRLHHLLRPLGGHVLFSIHDCLLFELPITSLQETLPLIVEQMETPAFPGLPSIPVDGKIGLNWGDTHDVYKDGQWQDNEFLPLRS